MRQMSPALEMMVARVVAGSHYDKAKPADPAELEHNLKGALGELQRTRPRLVEFAPKVALQRVMKFSSDPGRFIGPREQFAVLASRQSPLAAPH